MSVYIIIISSLNSRREALNIWKRKLGSSGTYNKLIEIFERAGYESYADSVRRIDREINNDGCSLLMLSQPNMYQQFKSPSQDEGDSPLPQPLTYPPLIPLNPSSELTPLQLSPEEQYVLINQATAEKLPEGEQEVIPWMNFYHRKRKAH